MSDSVYLYQSVSLSPFSQSVPSSSSHSLLTFPSTSLPFRNVSSSVLSIPLDIQHSLKPFTVTSGEMHCRAVMIHTDWIIHLYFLAYKLTWTHEEDSQFSPQMVLVVFRVLNTCVLDFCVESVVWSARVHGFLWFLLCVLVQVLVFSLAVNFWFFSSPFPVAVLGLDLISGAYLKKFTVSMVPSE